MKNLWKTYPVAVISLGVCLVFAGVTFAFSWQLATVELLFLLGCLAFELLHLYFHGRRVQRAVLQISNSLSFPDQKSAQDFPLPILAVDSGGKVLWFNDLFRTRVLGGKKAGGCRSNPVYLRGPSGRDLGAGQRPGGIRRAALYRLCQPCFRP